MSGTIPSSITNLKHLRVVELQQNSFNGPFPEVLITPKMGVLRLYDNDFSGTIPAAVANFSLTGALDIAHNRFTGKILYALYAYLSQIGIKICREGKHGVFPPKHPICFRRYLST